MRPVLGRADLTLELRGRVLICHINSWSRRLAAHIPVESVSVRRRNRPNPRLLLAALAVPALALLPWLALQFSLWPARLDFPGIEAAWLGVFGAGALFGIVNLIRAMLPRPAVRLEFDGDARRGAIEFWRAPGGDPRVDGLLQRLEEFERETSGEEAAREQPGFTWLHTRPLRLAILRAAAETCLLYLLFLGIRAGWEWMAGLRFELQPAIFLIFLLPAAWRLGGLALERLRLRAEPRRFQEGISAYNREEFDRAERAFQAVLDAEPGHVPSLYMLVQLCAKRYDLDQAFQYCARIASWDEGEAGMIEEELWVLKRLRARMEV